MEKVSLRLFHLCLRRESRMVFVTKDLDGYAGHIEMGQGEELIGVLCHVDVVPEGDGWKK
ncbi:hypothetical protein GCM10020331_030920 [Ectobacillus funiculus]